MKARTILAILVSALFLTLAVWNFNLNDFVQAFKHVSPMYILPGVFFYLISFFFRTLRWRFMLRSVKNIRMPALFSYIVIGYMANNLLPARLGEIVRAYVTGKSEGMSRSSAFASVVLERLFDGLTIVMILVVLMFAADVDRAWLRYMAWVSSLLFVGGLLFLFALAYQRQRVMNLTEKLVGIFPAAISAKILHILNRFVLGLSLLHQPKDFVISFLISFLVWICEVMVYINYLYAFGISVPLQAALLALVVVNLSSLIPSSPSYIGVFQFACVKTLAIFGIANTTALAWSVAIHATQIIPITILGLVLLSKLGMTMGELSQVELDENGENGSGNEQASAANDGA